MPDTKISQMAAASPPLADTALVPVVVDIGGGILANRKGTVLDLKRTLGVNFFGTFSDPNGNVTAERPAVYYNDSGGLWVKTNTGHNNTGWNQIV